MNGATLALSLCFRVVILLRSKLHSQGFCVPIFLFLLHLLVFTAMDLPIYSDLLSCLCSLKPLNDDAAAKTTLSSD